MSLDISTCLWFDDQAEAAARFYTGLLPDSQITEIFRKGADEAAPAFTVAFTLMGQRYWGLNGGPHYQLTPAASISVYCDDQAEIDRLWGALLDGGRAQRCGWLVDRFGLSWQIVPKALPRLLKGPNAGAVMAAMMEMVKFDIAALEAAAT